MKTQLLIKSVDLLTNQELIDTYRRSKEMCLFVGPRNREHAIAVFYSDELSKRGLRALNN